MSARPDHSEWFELVAGHALHALDAADEARVVEHLGECEECRDELDGHELTASHLASLADDAETAPPSWSAIRSAVVGEPAAPVVDLAERRQRSRPARWVLAAAAAVVVLVGATVASVQVLRSDRGGGQAFGAIASCAVNPGCQEIDLRSSDGRRRAAVLVSDDTATVQPLSLHAPADGRTFVLWQLPRGGAPIALGEFGSNVTATNPDKLVVSMEQTAAFAVSSEPSDTRPTTPTDVLALGGATA